MMKATLYKLKLKQDTDRVFILNWGHFLALILSSCIQLGNGMNFILFLVKFIALAIFYYFFFKTIKKFLYTYWTFSLITFLYTLYSIFDVISGSSPIGLLYFHLFVIICLFVQAYILSSPIYYPRVKWWEYDFRYRGDVKVKVSCKDEILEGRLTDLRRGAGCISLFKDYEIGDTLKVEIEEEGKKDYIIDADIVTKRRYSLGRPFRYGVRFNFDEKFSRSDFNDFVAKWEKESKRLSDLKYKKSHV